MSDHRHCILCDRSLRTGERLCRNCHTQGLKPRQVRQLVHDTHKLLHEIATKYESAYQRGYEQWPTEGEKGRGSEHSDPTATIVFSGAHAKVRAETIACAAKLREVIRMARLAEGFVDNALPPVFKPTQQAPGCHVCQKYGIWRPLYKKARCSSCYMYRYRNGVDAPEEVVKDREWTKGKRRYRVKD